MHRNRGPVYYGTYLKLDQLLGSQEPLSKKYGSECHDETLFILVHQVYELWFKQILHEFHSIVKMFNKSEVEEKDLSTVNARLERVKKIQGLLMDQLVVMETMTPMDFLEFRDLLVPASGFQSSQFREIEILMGLSTENRQSIDREFFLGRLNDQDRQRLVEVEKTPSLLKLVENWLERLPFTDQKDFRFWDAYKESIAKMLADDEKIINDNFAKLGQKAKAAQIENLNLTRKTFDSLLSKNLHDELLEKRKRTFSQKATLNALFILLFRDEPILSQPFHFLTNLMDIDENFTTWRYRHSMMAHRLLGTKIGTGGSSGHQYLKRAAENNQVYVDLFNLSTFIVPRAILPKLPASIKKGMNFYSSESENG